MTRARVVGLVVVLAIVAAAWTGWTAWQIGRDLQQAQRSAGAIRTSVASGDDAARDQAVEDLRRAAASADGRTSGLWWSMLSHLPVVGDDAGGVRALSQALEVIATDGLDPVLPVLGKVDTIVADGRIDLDVVTSLQQPLAESADAFGRAEAITSDVDSSGFVSLLQDRFDLARDELDAVAGGLSAATTAADVLPGMAGGDGARDYFLLFQNNAEIRGTGGLPGSWALVHADEGKLSLTKQGSALDFPMADNPVLPLTPIEENVYGNEIGTFFQDPGFAPDFPRAAELWNAHWERKFPEIPLDGVLALDPVALSYLVEGTGPIRVQDQTLTSDNLVQVLLNQTYLDLEPAAQDAFFQEAAKTVFDAATHDLASPTRFIEGLGRAAGEGRFLVSSFDRSENTQLADTAVAGALPGEDGATPHVDVALNDATGSKMSYYLRYQTDVQSLGCTGATQQLAGQMLIRQDISPAKAATLPDSITGRSLFAGERGAQIVPVRIYGPVDGSLYNVQLGGKMISSTLPSFTTPSGRDVVTVNVLLNSRDDVTLTWSMETGSGQTGAGEVGVTPSVVAGDSSSVFSSAC